MIAMANKSTERKRSYCRILLACPPAADRTADLMKFPERWEIIGSIEGTFSLGQAIEYVRAFDNPAVTPLIVYVPKVIGGVV